MLYMLYPLSSVSIDLKTLPIDIHGYPQNLQHTLAIFHEDMLTHIQASQTKMMTQLMLRVDPSHFLQEIMCIYSQPLLGQVRSFKTYSRDHLL